MQEELGSGRSWGLKDVMVELEKQQFLKMSCYFCTYKKLYENIKFLGEPLNPLKGSNFFALIYYPIDSLSALAHHKNIKIKEIGWFPCTLLINISFIRNLLYDCSLELNEIRSRKNDNTSSTTEHIKGNLKMTMIKRSVYLVSSCTI